MIKHILFRNLDNFAKFYERTIDLEPATAKTSST